MTAVTRLINTTPQRVWDVLADGWLYPVWVVGASRMRSVDDTWPAVGSKLHHSVGSWPALVDDDTEVYECTPLKRLELRARARPAGTAVVVVTLESVDGGTHVTIDEDANSGPMVYVPEPARAIALKWRNTETLQRLAYIAEGRP